MPNLPSQLARISPLEKVGVVGFSDHCPDTLAVDDHRVGRQHVTRARSLADGGHHRHPEQPPSRSYELSSSGCAVLDYGGGRLDPQLCGRICLRPRQIGHHAVREGVTEGGVRQAADCAVIQVGVRTYREGGSA